jgi:hypothetical protein
MRALWHRKDQLESECEKVLNELRKNDEQEKKLLFLRKLMNMYNIEMEFYPLRPIVSFYSDVEDEEKIKVQFEEEIHTLYHYHDDSYKYPCSEKYQKYLYDFLKARLDYKYVSNLMNTINGYPLVSDDDVKNLEKKFESVKMNMQDKENIVNLVNIAADDTRYEETMSQIITRNRELIPEAQRLQEEYKVSIDILNMHHNNIRVITNLEIIYSLYKWSNFFEISIPDLFSDVKTEKECLVLDTKKTNKILDIFVTEVKKMIPQCDSRRKCMQSIETKTFYTSEPNNELTFYRFIQSCMKRRTHYNNGGVLCEKCTVVIKNQTRGEKIYDVLCDFYLRDIVPLVFEYDDFKPLRQR